MKTVLSSILALTLALGTSTSVFAADPAVEEAWYNTRAENLAHEWAIAEREAKAGSQQFASSGSIQSDASRQNKTYVDIFEGEHWVYAH